MAPQNKVVAAGGTVALTVVAAGSGPFAYQWQRNGANLAGATGANLTLNNVQPANTGLYTAVVTNTAGSVTTNPAIVAVTISGKVAGAGAVIGSDIAHPNGNVFDQVLLTGAAAAVSADKGKVTRTSFIDLTDDIVQVEFSGAGTLSLVLDSPSGPAPPVNYNQAGVSYMKGHVGLVVAGADETTNVSVFAVGRATAFDPTGGYNILLPAGAGNVPANNGSALFQGHGSTAYDGRADLAFVAIASTNGKFGGVRTADGSYYATKGVTGIYAPGVQFTGPVYAGDINAAGTAMAMFVLGSAANNTWITGGDLFQANGQPVTTSGLAQLKFVDGSTAAGDLLTAQAARATMLQNGVEATAQLVVGPTLYYAGLRPSAAATSSTAAGYATIFFNPNTHTGTINVSFSNLTSAEVAGHLVVGAPGAGGTFVFGLGGGQISGVTWTFGPSGNLATSDLVSALQTGQLSVEIDSTNSPGGELVGSFLATAGSKAFVAPPAPALPAGALTVPTPTDAARLLTQATFGPTTAGITLVTSEGITQWLNDQMALPATSWVTGMRADAAAFPTPPPPDNSPYQYLTPYQAAAAWWKITQTAPDQLRQRVAFALSEILVVGDLCAINAEPEAKAKYYDILVNEAFGNYRQLLEDVTLSPIMGLWLSHLSNAKADPVKGTSPDENFAREAQQLFSIGLVQLQPDGTLMLDATGLPIPTYNQAMVSETAKVFTGWSFAIAPADATDGFGFTPPSTSMTIHGDDNAWLNPMRYFDAIHDKTQKNVVSLQQVPLDQARPTVIPANQTGPQDLKIMLDTLFNHPNTGPFISRQLIQRLVTSNPSPGYVYRVAQVFANDGAGTRGNLRAVVNAILTDYEARSPNVTGNIGYGKVKEPLLRVTAFFRAMKAAAPNGRYLDSYYGDPRQPTGYIPAGFMTFDGPSAGSPLGQALLRSATVFNFFSPDYSPPGAMAAAGLVAPEMQITDENFAIQVPNTMTEYIYHRPVTPLPANIPSPSPFFALDYSPFLPQAQNAAALADQLNLIFCANQMTGSTRTQILAALQTIPAASDLDRVQTAIALTILSPDAAVQK